MCAARVVHHSLSQDEFALVHGERLPVDLMSGFGVMELVTLTERVVKRFEHQSTVADGLRIVPL